MSDAASANGSAGQSADVMHATHAPVLEHKGVRPEHVMDPPSGEHPARQV